MNSSAIRRQMIKELADKIAMMPDLKRLEMELPRCAKGTKPALKRGQRSGKYLVFCLCCPGAVTGSTETEAAENWKAMILKTTQEGK